MLFTVEVIIALSAFIGNEKMFGRDEDRWAVHVYTNRCFGHCEVFEKNRDWLRWIDRRVIHIVW